MNMKAKQATKPVGRPRSFNEEQALEQAMNVFWKKGFEGASISDLAAATGMKPASIYAAFGNKEALFEKALERYLAGPAGFVRECMEEPTARAVAERTLRQTAEFLTQSNRPCGCMATQTALSCGEEAQPVHRMLIKLRRKFQEDLCERFERAKIEGDLPADADPGDLARFLAAVLQGMVVQAVGGANHDELMRLAGIALRAWPL
jgi:AcrR family transcriptional regulator